MKVNSLDLVNFGSHAHTVLELNGSRLTTFVGANGSGKSLLAIDAIRYAFFDDARGRTDDLVKLGQTDMSVRVEQTFAGAEYAITRGRSTKARGSSYLEFAIRDGEAWRPLTGATIRETQDAIGALLRMDAATFDTAVLLGQGQANRFAEATAGDRKKILGTVLGLDLWERAEARAREEARDVEGSTAADRATIGRLEAELTGRPGLESKLEDARRRDRELEDDEAGDQKSRAALLNRQAECIAKVEAARAAQAEVATAQAALDDVADRFRRVAARKAEAEGRLAGAERILTHTLAPTPLPDVAALEAEIIRQERAEAQDREFERAIATNSTAVEADRHTYNVAHQRWIDGRAVAEFRVEELARGYAELPPITCPKCSASFQHDQAGLGPKLLAARQALIDYGAAPEEPIHIAIEAAKVERLRANRRELAFDPIQTTSARVALRAALEAREAAAASESQRQVAVSARQSIAEADVEMLEIQTAGSAAREKLTAAQERATGGVALAAELAEVTSSIATVEGRLSAIASGRRFAAGEIAQATAMLERLDRLQAERDTLAGTLTDSDRKLARLRRLVAAFSVKGIPARIIESVLPELTGSANELLAQLRPGMTLDIRAQRAKADGKGIVEALDLIVQDDAGERALAMYSGGERTSVSLAIAVGLSRLVARRAGTAIRTLVIDEPDGLDADASRAFFQGLRILAHQGELERVIAVSHRPEAPEFADAVFSVSKDGAGSHVEQIA